jgi:hypothetical protein
MTKATPGARNRRDLETRTQSQTAQSKSHAELTETDDLRPHGLNVRPPLGMVGRVELNLQDVAGLSTPYFSS